MEEEIKIKIEWLKCPHGVPKTQSCPQCMATAQNFYNYVASGSYTNSKVPIYKGCPNQTCFCTGACKEIIGYRDKFPFEH